MERYTIISADCHGAAPRDVYKQYLEQRYWDDYDAFVDNPPAYLDYTSEQMQVLQPEKWEAMNGWRDGWFRDADRRLEELEQDGIVGEVVFPFLEGIGTEGAPPFLIIGVFDPEYQLAGARAHNRWIADFFSKNADRQGAIGLVTCHDVDAAVADIHWCKEAGIRGIQLTGSIGAAAMNHPRFDPVWSAMEDVDLPLHSHVGQDPNTVATSLDVTNRWEDGYGAQALAMNDLRENSRQLLTVMLLSGVFERHPKLRFVVTEQGTAWIPGVIGAGRTEDLFPGSEPGAPRPAKDYWERNCYAGASMMTRYEVELRNWVGVDKMMWGADYPHYEGTWPNSRKYLVDAVQGMPHDDVKMMLGENTARVYGFDIERLGTIAASVGPTTEELGTLAAS